MSQENIEVVRAVYDAWNAGDMDAVREFYDADVFMRMPEGWPEPGPYVGREAVMRQLEQLRETWDTDTFELVCDFIDVADRVLVRFIWHGAGYGPEAKIEATNVFMMRKGRIFLTDIPESTGADSFYGWLARWDAAWESWRVEGLEVRPVGKDRTISLFKMIVRGKGSGIELTREDAVVADVRNGKIVRSATTTATTSLRDVVYFHGHGAMNALLVLATYAILGAAATIILYRVRRPHEVAASA